MRLILGNIEISIPVEVGETEGDSVTHVLYLFIIMSFAEKLEKEWMRNGLKMIILKQHRNSPQSSGKITSHPAKTFSHKTLFEKYVCSLLMMENVTSRQEKTWNLYPILCSNTSTILGCKCNLAPSKNPPRQNEFFPVLGYFKLHTPPSTELPTDSSYYIPIIPKQKKENGETRQKNKRSNVRQRKRNKTNPHCWLRNDNIHKTL